MFALVVLMILPPAATAASGADPSNPSLDQYVESVPSSHGDKTPPGGSSHGRLSDSVRHKIAKQGGADAKQLQAVATSPTFGAPTSTATQSSSGTAGSSAGRGGSSAGGSGSGSSAGGARAPLAIDERAPSGLHALATAATSGEGSSIGLLVGGLVLITALLGGTALAARRNHPA
ncbi:MAG TPA: hypothetical protein VGC98_15785 [Thermoleophilaceae bacterium]